jgi:hypothetical protein
LHHKAKGLGKASLIEEDCKELEFFNQELQEIEAQLPAKEYAVYRQLTLYPSSC